MTRFLGTLYNKILAIQGSSPGKLRKTLKNYKKAFFPCFLICTCTKIIPDNDTRRATVFVCFHSWFSSSVFVFSSLVVPKSRTSQLERLELEPLERMLRMERTSLTKKTKKNRIIF